MHSSRRSLFNSGVINRKGFRINLKEEYLDREGKNKHVERERETKNMEICDNDKK